MSYRVEYEPVKKVRNVEKRVVRVPALTASCLLLFLLLVNGFWSQGREVLREILLPGDAAVTAAALEEFAQELKMGEPLGDAVEGFCRTVIEEAGIGQG